MNSPLTTREVANEISSSLLIPGSIEEWQVRRLFESGDLPEPPKFGGKRMIDPEMLPQIVAALRTRAWLAGGANELEPCPGRKP